MKFFLLLISLLALGGCNSDRQIFKQLKEKDNDFDKIAMFLADKALKNKEYVYLSIEELKAMPEIAAVVTNLEKDDLLNNADNFSNKCVLYKNKYCITFFVQRKKDLFSDCDYLLMYENLVGPLSGLDNLYTVNQNENINWLDIKVRKLNSFTNLVVVKYGKP